MGFLDRFKSQRDIVKEEIREIPWIELADESQIEEIVELSHAIPVLIFKHSTTCGISRMALKQFEKEYNLDKKDLKPYFLDLKKNREVSNLAASTFAVMHESPQVLLIKGGKCIYDASHGSINVADVEQHLLQ